MCRSGYHIFYHEDLNSAHFSDHLEKTNHENRSIGP